MALYHFAQASLDLALRASHGPVSFCSSLFGLGSLGISWPCIVPGNTLFVNLFSRVQFPKGPVSHQATPCSSQFRASHGPISFSSSMVRLLTWQLLVLPNSGHLMALYHFPHQWSGFSPGNTLFLHFFLRVRFLKGSVSHQATPCSSQYFSSGHLMALYHFPENCSVSHLATHSFSYIFLKTL